MLCLLKQWSGSSGVRACHFGSAQPSKFLSIFCSLEGAVASASRSAGSERISSISSGALELGIVRTLGGRCKSMPPFQTLAASFKDGDDGDRLTVMGESPNIPRINNLFAVSSLDGDKGGCVGHLASTQHDNTSCYLICSRASAAVVACTVLNTRAMGTGFQNFSFDWSLQPKITLKRSARKILLLQENSTSEASNKKELVVNIKDVFC